MIMGFTGSRNGMTGRQLDVVEILLKELRPETVHHGMCIGSDTKFHSTVRRLLSTCRIVGHPAAQVRKALRVNLGCDKVEAMAPPLVRNQRIVNVIEMMMATPESEEVMRSGTWSTIRKTKRAEKPLIVIEPSGEFEVFGDLNIKSEEILRNEGNRYSLRRHTQDRG